MTNDDDEKFWTSTRHWKHFDADQSLARVDPATGEMTVLSGGPSPWRGGSGSWRPLTDPNERRTMGIPDDDRAFYLRGAGREHFNLLIDGIEELRAKTDPANGEQSAKGKDLAAFTALEYAGRLVEGLVGWAIAHQVGLAAEGLSFFPIGPNGVHRDLPSYDEARAEVDAHRHELRGDQMIRGSEKDIDPIVARQAVLNLLHSNAGAMPHKLADSLVEAIRATEINDTRPMFQPLVKGRRVTLVEMELQLRAIGFAQFRSASKLYSVGAALHEVCSQYGVDIETARTWEKRLRKPEEFGELKVSRAIGFARNGGSYIKAIAETDRSKAQTELDADGSYGKAALIEAGESYRAEQRHRAG